MTMARGCGTKTQFDVEGKTPGNGALFKVKKRGQEHVSFIQCVNRKAEDPVFNVFGNISGMTDKKSPVSNMKMYFQSRKNAAPELNFDIDLTKEKGEDERYLLSNAPSPEEIEKKVQAKLCQLESDLRQLSDKMAFVKRLRMEWNAQKAGLCNRRFKDKPLCFESDFRKSQ